MTRRRGSRLWIGVALLAVVTWTSVALGVTPPNDDFANAITLTGTDVTRTGDMNVGATLQPGEATTVASAPGGASLWYSWTAPGNGMVVVETAGSDFDTLLGVYTGTSVDSLGEVATNDDFVRPPGTSFVRFAGTSGTTYRIRVDGYAGAVGSITLHVHQAPPPANDDFASPIVLGSTPATRTGDTNDGATLQAGETDTVAGGPGGASVWYRWTAPASGVVTLDTASSSFDTLLAVYTGSSVGALTEVASNDDVKVPPTSLVRFDATSGTTYRIRVDGFAEVSGAFNLHLQESSAPSPPNDDFAAAIALPGSTNTSRSGDTNSGATLETGESLLVAGVPGGGSVWYTWTAPNGGTATIDTATSTFDTLLGVYVGTNFLTEVASNDDAGTTDLTSSVRFQATGGTVYRIRVDGYARDAGTITLHVKENLPPANDDFTDAYLLNGVSDSRTNDTNIGATRQTGAGEAATVAGQSANKSVWYYWTAPQSTAVTIDTVGSDFDTLLGVYTGTAVNFLAEVASNDNVAPGDPTSKVSFPVVAGTVYRIRVDSSGAGGTIKLHVALATVSDVPTDVTGVPGNGQAIVSWTPPGSDGGSPIIGYDVTRYEAGQPPVTTSVGAVTQLTVNGLTNGTAYTFRVAARNVAGTGRLSTSSSPVTPRTVPDAPTNASATAAAGQATVSWSAPAYNGGNAIKGYAVTRYVNGVSQGTTNVGVVTQATIGGLTNGTTYTFKVAAKNDAGAGALSNESNAVTPRSVPDAPTGASATAGSTLATVSWSAPASDGGLAITGYDVTRYVGGVAQGTTSVGVTTQTTVTGLANGTTYTFRVAAKNSLGTGAQSTDSNAVTPRTVPDAPTNASATAGAGQATVSWGASPYDGGSAITGYVVTSYVGGVPQGWISVGVVTQATFGGLTNGTTYTFRVAAKNAAGSSAESADSNGVAPALSRFRLTIAKSGSGTGTVTSSVGAINCGASCTRDFDQGTSVTLTASASSGSRFAGWSGPCEGIGSCTVWIDAAKTVTATFSPVQQQQPQTTSSKCVVPNVKKKPLATAKRKITAAHCKVGKVTKAKSKTIKKGSVVSQKPAAGKKLARGSKIGLVVSAGKP
jgi:Fibronectin type III domain/PASTA domain/Divergent InlB B-repeat domain